MTTYAVHKIRSNAKKSVMVCGAKNWYHGTVAWEKVTCKTCLARKFLTKKTYKPILTPSNEV